MSRQGIAAVGLTDGLRQRFGDGEEHTIAESVAAVAHLIPPEIAARVYRAKRPRSSWPPPPDQYAQALYLGQRALVLSTLRSAGATWGSRPNPRATVLTFRLPAARDVALSASTQRERRAMAKGLLAEFPSKSDHVIGRQCGLSYETIRRMRRGLSITDVIDSPRVVERNGVTFEMNVANIGRSKRAKATEDAGPTMTVPITIDGALSVLRRLSRGHAMRAVNAFIDGEDGIS